ncbi:MAG: hypothetical protein ACRDN0_36950 [Trebonia sp.]
MGLTLGIAARPMGTLTVPGYRARRLLIGNELRSYREHRLELGDMLRAALHLARSSRDTDAENQARDLLARLAGDASGSPS